MDLNDLKFSILEKTDQALINWVYKEREQRNHIPLAVFKSKAIRLYRDIKLGMNLAPDIDFQLGTLNPDRRWYMKFLSEFGVRFDNTNETIITPAEVSVIRAKGTQQKMESRFTIRKVDLQFLFEDSGESSGEDVYIKEPSPPPPQKMNPLPKTVAKQAAKAPPPAVVPLPPRNAAKNKQSAVAPPPEPRAPSRGRPKRDVKPPVVAQPAPVVTAAKPLKAVIVKLPPKPKMIARGVQVALKEKTPEMGKIYRLDGMTNARKVAVIRKLKLCADLIEASDKVAERKKAALKYCALLESLYTTPSVKNFEERREKKRLEAKKKLKLERENRKKLQKEEERRKAIMMTIKRSYSPPPPVPTPEPMDSSAMVQCVLGDEFTTDNQPSPRISIKRERESAPLRVPPLRIKRETRDHPPAIVRIKQEPKERVNKLNIRIKMERGAGDGDQNGIAPADFGQITAVNGNVSLAELDANIEASEAAGPSLIAESTNGEIVPPQNDLGNLESTSSLEEFESEHDLSDAGFGKITAVLGNVPLNDEFDSVMNENVEDNQVGHERNELNGDDCGVQANNDVHSSTIDRIESTIAETVPREQEEELSPISNVVSMAEASDLNETTNAVIEGHEENNQVGVAEDNLRVVDNNDEDGVIDTPATDLPLDNGQLEVEKEVSPEVTSPNDAIDPPPPEPSNETPVSESLGQPEAIHETNNTNQDDIGEDDDDDDDVQIISAPTDVIVIDEDEEPILIEEDESEGEDNVSQLPVGGPPEVESHNSIEPPIENSPNKEDETVDHPTEEPPTEEPPTEEPPTEEPPTEEPPNEEEPIEPPRAVSTTQEEPIECSSGNSPNQDEVEATIEPPNEDILNGNTTTDPPNDDPPEETEPETQTSQMETAETNLEHPNDDKEDPRKEIEQPILKKIKLERFEGTENGQKNS